MKGKAKRKKSAKSPAPKKRLPSAPSKPAEGGFWGKCLGFLGLREP
jgi:hypothetical protein